MTIEGPLASELERPDGRPDVLLVRRFERPARPFSLHGPSQGHWTLAYTYSGAARVRIRGSEFRVEPDSLMVWRRDRPVTWAKEPRATGWTSYCACFELGTDWHPPRGFQTIADGVYRTQVGEALTRQRIRDAFGRLVADAHARMATRAVGPLATTAGDAYVAHDGARRELMLMTLREVMLLASDDMKGTTGVDARVRNALEIMAADLTARHTRTSLGRACDLSPSGFGNLFRSELGVSPVRALRLMRLRQAALELLHTDSTVEQIADATGFTSISHLSHEFRRHFGVSPRTYRARVS
jgi:AraC family transcriptional regulator of arabinose operon